MPPSPHCPTEAGVSDAPLFSIVMAVFNASDYVAEAVASVQAQSRTDWELIIVDDGSTDDSLARVQGLAYLDPRIQIIPLGVNLGPARARNKAIENARGRFIAFLDSDDLWFPQKLERQAALFAETHAPLIFSAYEKIGPAGERAQRIVRVPGWIDYRGLLNRTAIATSTAVYDTARVGLVLMPDIAKRQDFGLWLRILRTGGAARSVADALAGLRKRPDSLSSNKSSAIYYTWQVYRSVEGLGRIRSSYHFCRYLTHAVGKALR